MNTEQSELLREYCWSIVKSSALYGDQLLSNDQCDSKADELYAVLSARSETWITNEESKARGEAERAEVLPLEHPQIRSLTEADIEREESAA